MVQYATVRHCTAWYSTVRHVTVWSVRYGWAHYGLALKGHSTYRYRSKGLRILHSHCRSGLYSVVDQGCLSWIMIFFHFGSRIQDLGSRISDPGSRIQDLGSRISDPGSRISVLRSWNKQQEKKRRGRKNLLERVQIKISQSTKNCYYLSAQKYGLGIWDQRCGICGLESWIGKNFFCYNL